jgi:hypothetical protein
MMWNLALGIIWGLVGGVLGALALQVILASPAQLATVDLQQLIDIERTEMVRLATDQNITPEEAVRIEARLAQFGRRLDAAVREVAENQHWVIVQSQAIAAGNVPDVTAEVKRWIEREHVRE